MKFGYAGASFALLLVITSGFVLDEAYAQTSNFRVTDVDSVWVDLAWDNLDSSGATYYNVEMVRTKNKGNIVLFGAEHEYNVTDYHWHNSGETVNYTLTVYGPSWSILTETTITVTIPANKPPTADAGMDMTVDSGGKFTLDGTGSIDDNKDLLEYEWMQTAGPHARLYYIGVALLEVTPPNVDENTTLTFKLTVTDYSGDSDDDFVNVTVRPAYNAPPNANASDDRTVAPGEWVRLNAVSSWDDNTPTQDLNYSWEQIMGTNVTLSDPQGIVTSFTVPDTITSMETLRFNLTVTNRLGLLDIDSVDIVVVPPANNAPTADAGNYQDVEPGDLVTLNGSNSFDPDQSDSLSYLWYQKSGTPVTLSNYTAIKPNFNAPIGNPTLLVFELTVTDLRGDTGTDEVQVAVAAHDPPDADAGPEKPMMVYYNDTVTLNASNTTYNHTAMLTYTWTKTEGPSDAPDSLSGETVNLTIPILGPDADQPTYLIYNLTVSDGVYTGQDTIYFYIYPEGDPTARGYADYYTAKSGQIVTLNGRDSFDDQGPITGNWKHLNGPIVNLQGSGLVSNFTAPDVATDSTVEFLLTVYDNKGNSDTRKVNVTIVPNQMPTADAGDDLTVRNGTRNIWITGEGSDPDNDHLDYSWKQLDGENVDELPQLGKQIRFTAPSISSVLVFELTVSDGVYEVTDTVTITVKTNDHAPTANAGPDKSATEGDNVMLSGSGYDNDGDPIIYLWKQSSGTPVTLRDLDTQNPSFTGPNVGSETSLTLVFELMVSDDSKNGTDNVTVTILPSTNAPSANAGENRTVRSRNRVDLNGIAFSPRGSDVKYEWKKLSGPESINIVNSNQIDAYFTAPDVTNETEAIFRFKVSVGNLYAEDTVNITIRPNERHDINAGRPMQKRVNTGDTVTLDANVTNPDNDPLMYDWELIYTSGYELSQAQKDKIVNAIDQDSENVSFTAPILPNGKRVILIFFYHVSDGLYTDHDFAYVYVYG